jgi:hypothetical protein
MSASYTPVSRYNSGVKALQMALGGCDHYYDELGYMIDGLWGANTTNAVRMYQAGTRYSQYPITADGVYGVNTHNTFSRPYGHGWASRDANVSNASEGWYCNYLSII